MGDFLALLSALCWAAANVTIGVGIARDGGAKGADNGAFLSILLTAVMAALVWLWGGVSLAVSKFSAEGVWWFGVAGALTIFIGRVLLYSSIRWLGAIRGASLKRLVPFFSVLLGVLVLGESPSPMLLLGMALIFAGFVVLLQESMSQRREARQTANGAAALLSNPGFVYGTVSALAYAAGNVARKYGIGLLPEPAFGAMFGCVVGAVLFLLTGAFVRSYGDAIRSTFTRFNRWLFAAGIFGSAGQILFFIAIDYSTVSRAAMIVSTEVFLTILLTVLLVRDHEKVTLAVMVAAVLGGAGTLVILADRPAKHLATAQPAFPEIACARPGPGRADA